MMTRQVQLEAEFDPRINLAAQQNDVPVVRKITITNRTDRPIRDVLVSVSVDPAFAEPWTAKIDRLNPDATHAFADVDLSISTSSLLERTERQAGHMLVSASTPVGELARHRFDIELLAPNEWPGASSLPELLAAFVTPNDPALGPILKRAAEGLGISTGDPSLNGYQSRDPQRVANIAAAIYGAVQRSGVSYVNPAASFEATGQKIRTVGQTLADGLGTCLDITSLVAAGLEQVGLHPLLVVVDRHAFPGLWLHDFFLPEPTIDDPGRIAKRVRLGEALVFDSSAMAQGVPFAGAVDVANRYLSDPAKFRFAVDVQRSRRHRIRPLQLEPTRIARSALEVELPAVPATAGSVEIPGLPIAKGPDRAEPGSRTRLDKWRDRLLDLSLRNRLLNFRETNQTIRFNLLDLPKVEDVLAAGKSYTLSPRAALMSAGDPRDPQLHFARTGEDAQVTAVREDQASGILRADHEAADLDKRLLELYRRSRTSFQETGAVTLYLAIGILEWFESDSSTAARRAPLLMVPVELVRGSANRPFQLKHADEESRVNATLLKKLSADFGLDTAGMDQIPEDDSGIDVRWVFDRFTRLIKDKKRWDVKESAFLAEFSFAKFLMWLDLQANLEHLLRNPVVRHVMHGKCEAFPLATPVVRTDELDRARRPDKLFTVVDADPTQLQAILAAEDGSSFVLQGPPGTGKSQTITNLVSQLLACGKSVLFVSEKMAALNVVHDRLAAVGLGPFCLELHSHKASKRAVMEQLGESFRVGGARSEAEWTSHAEELGRIRDNLNEFAAFLGRSTDFGMTMQSVVSRLIGLRSVRSLPLRLPNVGGMDGVALARVRQVVDALALSCKEAGGLHSNPWSGVERGDWTPAWQADVDAAVRALAGTTNELLEKATAVEELLGLQPSDVLDAVGARVDVVRELLASPRPPKAILSGPSEETSAMVATWCGHVSTRQARWQELTERYSERLLELDLVPLAQRFNRWGSAFFLLAFVMLWAARKMLRTAVPSGRLPSNRQIAEDLEGALEVRSQNGAIASFNGEARAVLGRYWRGGETDVGQAEVVAESASRFRQAALLATSGHPAALERLFLLYTEQNDLIGDGTSRRSLLEDFAETARRIHEQRGRVEELLGLDLSRVVPDQTLSGMAGRLQDWIGAMHMLRSWCALQKAITNAGSLGLSPVVQALADGQVTPDQLPDVCERSVLQAWWTDAAESEPWFRDFRGSSHEALIERFQKLDSQAQTLAQDELVSRLAARVPDLHAPGEEMGTLRRQLQLQKRHKPIRKLFAEVPKTLRRLKPCVLMSPLSVAQFLDPSLERFDVVVFDEASQIPPWDAIGAIARGDQVIVVGDSKQLPPTSFFSSAGSDDDESVDENDVEEMDSILEETIAAGLRELSLRWHYRSRHESLIAFSNHHYYDGGLNTFPSRENEVQHLGVKLAPVDGYYDRGLSRTNRAEAEAVVEEVIRILGSNAERIPSVGIVTFSLAQQRLIEDLMESALQKAPGVEAYFGEGVHEPVFIKNLENVQGDERDVMLFSICYGPDKLGRVAMNFGPLNREGGERRLNVAITRARERLVVFSTLRADQIDLRRTRAVGVAHLKTFLDYADRGMAAIDATVHLDPEGEPESPFELEVRNRLLQRGWKVHCQVGTSGYRIDLAVVDRERPGAYVLGVECDGATYHSSACARERDRLRQQVLERLGWRLHRIWSTDWWLDPEREMARLVEAIERAEREPRARAPSVRAPRKPRIEPDDVPEIGEMLANGPSGREQPTDRPTFRLARAESLGEPDQFYEVEFRRQVAKRLLDVINTSGPILRLHAYREVMSCWGLSSLGKRIRKVLDEALGMLLARNNPPLLDGETLWPTRDASRPYRAFRIVDPSDPRTQRKADEIPPAEIANAAAWVLERSKTISREDLAKEAAFALGIQRLGKKVRAAMDQGIDVLIAQGRCHVHGDELSIDD